ncbi:MAG: HEAT repeat domain-containing protein [Planctomycetes bacterium]|nr:HEAT repeat domain-containing protein [Planctomycetota bacterium]
MLNIVLLASLCQQQPDLENNYRVHLRNGNIVDGIRVSQDDRRGIVTLRTTLGLLIIRYADVARATDKSADRCCAGTKGAYRFHELRVRTKGEKAALTKVDEPKKETTTSKDTSTEPRKDDTTKRTEEPTKRTDEPAKRTEDPTKTGRVDPVARKDGVPPIEPSDPPTTSPEVRRRIHEHLAKIKAAPPEERDALVSELLKLGEGAAEYLADLVDRVDDASAQAVFTALQGQKDPHVLSILFDKMASQSPQIRVAVLQTLMSVVEKEHAPRIRKFLDDPDANVRASTLAVLRKLDDEDSLDAIARRTADPDLNVGRTAASFVMAMAKRLERVDEVIEILKIELQRAKGKSRGPVIDALGRSERKEAADIFIEYIDDPESDVRAIVAQACGALRAEEQVDPLVRRLGEETVQWVKTSICRAFQEINSKKAVDPLIDLMERDDNYDVDEAAMSALKAVTGQKEGFGHDHQKWRDWWEDIKRRAGDN